MEIFMIRYDNCNLINLTVTLELVGEMCTQCNLIHNEISGETGKDGLLLQ